MKSHPQYNNLLQFEILSEYDSLVHFSTTCEGGVSKESYASFNLGEYSGDDQMNVFQNRRMLASMLNIEMSNLLLPYQTHEDKISVIDNYFMELTDVDKKAKLWGVDALVTNLKNVCIGVTTADCTPLLIYDPVQGVLAAVHAGWRSTVAKIAVKTVEKMEDIYGCKASDLKVGIAPCISQERFEVGKEVISCFIEAGFPINDIAYHNKQTGKKHIDLSRANKLLLEKMGVTSQNIEISGLCTYSNPDIFFSARRQTIKSGRMLTGGLLK